MENHEPKQEKIKTMPCKSTDRLISELESDGYEYDWSFHTKIPEQWNDACNRVERIKTEVFWEPILVQGQDEAERKEGVAYIYKRKKDKYKPYELSQEEQKSIIIFISKNQDLFHENEREVFGKFVRHLQSIQKPLRGIAGDSIIHGIDVANFIMEINPSIDKVTLLAALGHDWDRACGELAIKQEDFSEKQYDEYKQKHAENSANLFCRELEKFFGDTDLVKQVHSIISIHEQGGTPEADLIDFADAVALLEPKTSNWYRNKKLYKDQQKQTLPEEALEKRRIKGFEKKVRFMVTSLTEDQKQLVKDYVKKHFEDYDSEVQDVLRGYFEI